MWDPKQYSLGCYIQNSLSDEIIDRVDFSEGDIVIDAGCGQGEYTSSLAIRYPTCHFIGIDNDRAMLEHAREYNNQPNIEYLEKNIEADIAITQVDKVISFWCLHWTNIDCALKNLHQSLNSEGKLHALLWTPVGGTLLDSIQNLKACSDSVALKEFFSLSVNDFLLKDPTEVKKNREMSLNSIVQTLKPLECTIQHISIQIELPSIDIYEAFIRSAPFLKNFSSNIIEAAVEDMITFFKNTCEHYYQGRWIYHSEPLYVALTKS